MIPMTTAIALLPLLLSDCSPTIVAASPHAGADGSSWVQVRNDCDYPVGLGDWTLRWGKSSWAEGASTIGPPMWPGQCRTYTGVPLPEPGVCAVGLALFNWCYDDALTDTPDDAIALGGELVCGLNGLGEKPDAEWPAAEEAAYVVNGEVVISYDHGPISDCAVPPPPPKGPGDKAPPPKPLKIIAVATRGNGSASFIQVKNETASTVALGDFKVRYGWTTFEAIAPQPAKTLGPGECIAYPASPTIPLQFFKGCALGVAVIGGKGQVLDEVVIGDDSSCLDGYEIDLEEPAAGEAAYYYAGGWKAMANVGPMPCL